LQVSAILEAGETMSAFSPSAALPEELSELAEQASERRIATRKVVSLLAKVQLPDGTVLHGHSTDISQTGIGLFSPRMLYPEEQCTLQIDLSVCGMNMELRLAGRVCYCHPQGEGKFRAGMRFVGMDAEAAQLLGQLLR
jgi:c-di-GMP-binding flagellar brake protein YcgR